MSINNENFKFVTGALFSPVDVRDYRLACVSNESEFPEEFELKMPKVKNQKNINSCVAHSVALTVEYFNILQHNDDARMSTDYIYGNRTNMYYNGAGMYTRKAVANTCKYGDVLESDFPGNTEVPDVINNFEENKYSLYDKGTPYRFSSYYSVKNTNEIKTALMTNGPVIFAMPWYDDIKVEDGIIHTSQKGNPGGHCMVIYGWNKDGWLIQNSWGCYDDQTEVLTNNGFKKFFECTDDDLFATINENGFLEYQKANHYFEYDYNGQMFNYANSKINLCVTPNHNIYYRTVHKPFMLQQAQNIKQKNLYFKRTAKWDGIEQEYFCLPSIEQNTGKNRTQVLPEIKIPMEDFLTFVGYYLSEGSCGVADYTKYNKGREYMVSIAQTKKHTKEIMRHNLNKLPFNIIETKRGFQINNQQLWNYVKDFGYSYNKKIPNELLKLSPYYLKYLFEGLMLGDGSSTICKNGSYKNTYYTSSPFLRDQFQELCLKLGYASNVYKDDRIGRINKNGVQRYINYQIRIQKYMTDLDKDTRYSKSPEITTYNGKIYCVEVPNHTLFIRRNGKTCWCGNSFWGDKGRAILPYDIKIKEAYGIVDNIINDVEIKKPYSSKFGQFFAKIINWILNLFRK